LLDWFRSKRVSMKGGEVNSRRFVHLTVTRVLLNGHFCKEVESVHGLTALTLTVTFNANMTNIGTYK